MGRLAFIAKLWGIVDELKAVFHALQGARLFIDGFAAQLEAGDQAQKPVTVTLQGAQLRGLLKIVKLVQTILDKIPAPA